MSMAELRQEWLARDVIAKSAEWDSQREEAAPLYRQALDDFLEGTTDVIAFRTRIDSLSKSHGWWGFRGTGQMFFNQLVKAADSVELTNALRGALPAPTSSEEAEAKLDGFLAAVDRARDRAELTGATKPGRGRINFFVSFFWELADRETWPTFFPNSRNVLEQHGLIDTSQPQPALYTAYRTRIMELKELLGTTTWGVEHLLWNLGQGAPSTEPEPQAVPDEGQVPAPETMDLYAGYRLQGLHFPDEVVTSVVLSLATKRFLILSGISGTGKTQIALGLARHLEAGPDGVVPGGGDLPVVQGAPPQPSDAAAERYVLVAVRSDWTDPRGLVGFFNPLANSYVRTKVVDLLLRAADDPGRPYFVILDEMNLARVEYYFSDFLSSLESGEPVDLMSPGVEQELLALGQDDIPAHLYVPANVSFIGTVNVDETTQSFSPKVLDRANVIEFSDVDIERALGHPVDDAAQGLRLTNGRIDPAWLCAPKSEALAPAAAAQAVDSFTEALEDVHDLLARSHLHFGYRVIGEISAFVGHALQSVAGDPESITQRAFDLQIQQKILPKLTGGRELEAPLARLLHYCLTATKPTTTTNPDEVRGAARKALEPGDGGSEAPPPTYPGSARKLLRMLDRLADTGFVGALE
jgi:hypothetical protein